MADMKPPEKGGKPKRIEAKGPPGGPYTPGARKGKPMPPRSERQRQREVTGGIRARRGLPQLLAEQGGDRETIEAAEMIESMPGGPELLYSYAAEQLLNRAGAGSKETKKLRLYRIGGSVQDKGNRYSSTTRGVGSGGRQFQDSEYAKGGLAQAAEKTREGGRGDDSVLLHMTPEEFEVIQSMWGAPDVNPDTGLPEYGFLSKIWKKVKKNIKKVFSSKIFQIVAPIALSIFAPGLGAAIGKAIGAGSGALGSVVGNALLRGGMSAAGGGDFMTGAISGAVSGGLGQMVGDKLQGVVDMSDQTAALVGSSLTSGAASELTGGDFASGAMQGALSQMLQPTMEGITERGQEMFGVETTPGQVFATKVTPGTEAIDAIAAGEAMYDPATGAFVTDPTPEQIELASAMTPGAATDAEIAALPAPETPVVTPSDPGTMDAMIKYGLPLMAGLGAVGQGPYEEGQPPELPPHMLEPLPIYESTRAFIGPTDPQAYYQYGRAGAPLTGEQLFITPDPFAGEVGTPTTGGLEAMGTPMGQGIQGMIQTGQVIPAAMVRGQGGMLRNAGYTRGQDGNWYPPGQQQLGQGTGFSMGGMHEQRFADGGSPVSRADYWQQNADVPRTIPTVSRAGGYTEGPGTGRSDDIPARLSDGEYVIDAETVALLGDGSGKAGAQRLDEMRRNLRKHKAKNLKKGEFTHKAKTPENYMPQLRAAVGRA